ncbi:MULTISPECIES: hypothetical protein [unclassified Nocardia]|uniref:hypothetical protein n=1 Tax=unclassified Nocardia TaxID=2637762 RepID=UPI00278C8881|nr:MULTISPECIES: hypothetical protein [unclassified Nocardia]
MSLPSLRVVRARWLVLVAVCAAVEGAGTAGFTRDGYWFAAPGRISSALFALSDGRGVWVAESGVAPSAPPEWVSQVLAERQIGVDGKPLLWWDGQQWGGTRAALESEWIAMFPGFESTKAVAEELLVFHAPPDFGVEEDDDWDADLDDGEEDEDHDEVPAQWVRDAAFRLVRACETQTVDRGSFRAFVLSCSATGSDVDRGYEVLSRAGLTAETSTAPVIDGVDGLTEQQALDIVARHLVDVGIDLTSYAPNGLAAQRLEFGWWVYAPTEETRMGAAWFYVGDDGVVEQSSSSMGPDLAAEQFAVSYRNRHPDAPIVPAGIPRGLTWATMPPTRLGVPSGFDRLHIFHYLARAPLPEPDAGDIEWSRQNPGEWRYFTDPHVDRSQVQRHNIQGGIKADGAGGFSERWVNPDFTPTREYLGGLALTTDIDVALYRLLLGYRDIGDFVKVLTDCTLTIVLPPSDPEGTQWPTYPADGYDHVLNVYTSATFLPPDANPWLRKQIDGGQVALNLSSRDGTLIRFNPGTQLSARLPGNDLLFWTCELAQAEAIAQGVDPAALFGPPMSTGTPA